MVNPSFLEFFRHYQTVPTSPASTPIDPTVAAGTPAPATTETNYVKTQIKAEKDLPAAYDPPPALIHLKKETFSLPDGSTKQDYTVYKPITYIANAKGEPVKIIYLNERDKTTQAEATYNAEKKKWILPTNFMRSDAKFFPFVGGHAGFGYAISDSFTLKDGDTLLAGDSTKKDGSALSSKSYQFWLMAKGGFETLLSKKGKISLRVEGSIGLLVHHAQEGGQTPTVSIDKSRTAAGAALGAGVIVSATANINETHYLKFSIPAAIKLGILKKTSEPIPTTGVISSDQSVLQFEEETYVINAGGTVVSWNDIVGLDAGAYVEVNKYKIGGFGDPIDAQGFRKGGFIGLSLNYDHFFLPRPHTGAMQRARNLKFECNPQETLQIVQAAADLGSKRVELVNQTLRFKTPEEAKAFLEKAQVEAEIATFDALRDEYVRASEAEIRRGKELIAKNPGADPKKLGELQAKVEGLEKHVALMKEAKYAETIKGGVDSKKGDVADAEDKRMDLVYNAKIVIADLKLTDIKQPNLKPNIGAGYGDPSLEVKYDEASGSYKPARTCPPDIVNVYRAAVSAVLKIKPPEVPSNLSAPTVTPSPLVISSGLAAMNSLGLKFGTYFPGDRASFKTDQQAVVARLQGLQPAQLSAELQKGLGGTSKFLPLLENFFSGKAPIGRLKPEDYKKLAALMPYMTIGVYGYADKSDKTSLAGKAMGADSPSNLALSELRAKSVVEDLQKHGALPKLIAFGQKDAIARQLRPDDVGKNFKQYSADARGIVFDFIEFDAQKLQKDIGLIREKQARKETLQPQEQALLDALIPLAQAQPANGKQPAEQPKPQQKPASPDDVE